MLISREEFYRRDNFRLFQITEEKEELMSVDMLYKEAVADAPFRNHEFLFNKKTDFKITSLQEDHVGIKKKFPDIKTEQDRIDKITEELEADTYQSVPVFRDCDHISIIYIDDGFHRIYCAHLCGMKVIRVKSKYGKFVLSDSICIRKIPELLDMLIKMFPEITDMKKLKTFIEKAMKKNPKNKYLNATFSYGKEKYNEKDAKMGYVV